jgi:alpha-galactosidase/6-phospho-beta-glucosidase family protein
VPIGLTRPVREPIPSLVQTLKHYEWATVEAARIRTEDAAVEALALNPLVAGRDLARALVRRRQELPAGPLFAKTVS